MVEFQRCGWVLVDATYQPIDKLSGAARNRVINQDYPMLHADLATLTPNHSVPLIIIKANVCRLLEPMLKRDGFSVLNCGVVIPFPSSGQQNDFCRKFALVLNRDRGRARLARPRRRAGLGTHRTHD